jgi:hypothetical protein
MAIVGFKILDKRENRKSEQFVHKYTKNQLNAKFYPDKHRIGRPNIPNQGKSGRRRDC